MDRRAFLRAGLVGTGGAALALVAPAQSESEAITPEAQTIIDKSLAQLASQQGADGSFADTRTGLGNVAITGLAGLALMAAGHQPSRGRFGNVVSRAADYILKKGNQNSPVGYLNNADANMTHGSMYQHGFGALFLAEVYGMQPNPIKQKAIRMMLEKAIGMTRNSQNSEGGWRYEPKAVQLADVSVTVAQLMALRAAKNAGVAVPKSVVDKCVAYIKACQMPDGGFCYIKGQGGIMGSAFARTAAAIVGLFSAGVYEGKEIDAGLRYMTRYTPGRRTGFVESRPDHYFYGQYYAALAMWTAGGNYWAEWFPAIRDELISRYRSNNGWIDTHGTNYGAAMACIILQLPNNYLPIMQK
jgi:hypothetical protein